MPEIPCHAFQNIACSSKTSGPIVSWTYRPFPSIYEFDNHEDYPIQRAARLVCDLDRDKLKFEELANFSDLNTNFPVFMISGVVYGQRQYSPNLIALGNQFYKERKYAESVAELGFLSYFNPTDRRYSCSNNSELRLMGDGNSSHVHDMISISSSASILT